MRPTWIAAEEPVPLALPVLDVKPAQIVRVAAAKAKFALNLRPQRAAPIAQTAPSARPAWTASMEFAATESVLPPRVLMECKTGKRLMSIVAAPVAHAS